MKHAHPAIAQRTFTHPQGSEDCFTRFIRSFDVPPQQLLDEIFAGIGEHHGQAIPIASAVPDEPIYLLELPRFIVVYRLLATTVQVGTLLGKRDFQRPDHIEYFTTSEVLPPEPPVHADIADKPITYVQLDKSFAAFAVDACGAASADLLLEDLEDTIRARHGQARQVLLSAHGRPVWKLKTYSLRFQYQVLADKVEVGGIGSRETGHLYEASQYLLAEYTP